LNRHYCPSSRRSPAGITPVVLVEDDPADSQRVVVTTAARNRASMTSQACSATCRPTADALVVTDRVWWDR
jgi:hypothetical protein